MVAAGRTEFCGLVRSNETAALIIDLLKNETTVEKIVDKMAQEYQVSKEILLNDVGMVIETLQKIGAIDE